RKRKSHTKSRRGCGNCKLRRVKCDEGKPCCKRCQSFGVTCNYDRLSSDLQVADEAAFIGGAPPMTAISLNRQVLSMLNDSLHRQSPSKKTMLFGLGDLAIVNRYHERTILTMGTPQTRHVYQRESVKLAFEHPFLCHLVITVTLMHDRFSVTTKQSPAELVHWLEGTAHFHKLLANAKRGALSSSEKDAVWIASVLIGCATLAQVDSDNPEELWPLKCAFTDLNWLKMNNGKYEIWRHVNLRRPDSALRAVAQEHRQDPGPMVSDQDALRVLPPELQELLEVSHPSASPLTNPYYIIAAILGRLLPLDANPANMLVFITFLSQITARFQTLLEDKDPRALLLLLYFDAKIIEHGRWWWWNRSVLEGRAICIYLERYHSNISHLDLLMEYPK
ncbi:hypothetical protein B0T26DRAFT_599032, partial [Lasiosphaeria miniovina]